MSKRKLNGTETEVTTEEFNRYFNQNYPYISHSLSNKQLEKWLNQDVIRRVSLSKKADYFQDYILSQSLEDEIQLMAGGNIKATIDDKNGLIYLNGAKHEFLIGNDGDIIYDWVNSKNKNEENGSMLVNELISIAGVRENNYQIERAKSIRKLAKFIKENLKKKMMAGGSIDNENKLMVANNNKQLRHHTEELDNALQNAKHIPAWVVSLVGRATQDISDVTHYLDGTTQYGLGGGVEVPVKKHKLYMHLTNDDVERLGERLNWRKEVERDSDGNRSIVYYGNKDGDEYVANDGVSVKERNLEKIKEALKDVRLDRVDKVEIFETSEYKKAENGANIRSGGVGDQFNYEIGGL